jgi:hypothetical protein
MLSCFGLKWWFHVGFRIIGLLRRRSQRAQNVRNVLLSEYPRLKVLLVHLLPVLLEMLFDKCLQRFVASDELCVGGEVVRRLLYLRLPYYWVFDEGC